MRVNWDLIVGVTADSEHQVGAFILKVSEIVHDVAERFPGISVAVGGVQKEPGGEITALRTAA